MKFLEYTMGLVAGVGQFLAYFWPVTLAISVHVAIAVLVTAWKGRFTRRTPWVVLPVAVVPVTLFWGTVFRYRGGPGGGAPWAIGGLYVFLVLGVALGVATTLKLKGNRWLAASTALASLWVSFLAAGVAGMAVSGDSL